MLGGMISFDEHHMKQHAAKVMHHVLAQTSHQVSANYSHTGIATSMVPAVMQHIGIKLGKVHGQCTQATHRTYNTLQT